MSCAFREERAKENAGVEGEATTLADWSFAQRELIQVQGVKVQKEMEEK